MNRELSRKSFIIVLTWSASFSLFGEPVMLPQDHDYQRQLREFMGTLKEADFDHGVTTAFSVPAIPEDPEARYRTWLLALSIQPVIGTKRGYPSVTAPPRLFLLSSIEGGEEILQPPVWPTPLAWLAAWDWAGNPYRNSRALKLRAFVNICVEMMMLDHQIERAPEKGGNRPDWLGPHLITFAYPYLRVRDVLPSGVQAAYETGLRKMARRIIEWEIKGEEPNMDAFSLTGLQLASQALGDPGFSEEAEGYCRGRLADAAFFHPAGYFVDHGGIDVEFGGMAVFALNWTALASNWPFAREAIERYYRLAAHLSLPEPDGAQIGPSQFNTRIGGQIWPGQWDWSFREYGAAMITDEAAHLTKGPGADEWNAAFVKLTGKLNQAVSENPPTKDPDGTSRFLRNEEITSQPWKFLLWPNWNFPVQINFVHDHYRAGSYTHRLKLEQDHSPMLRSPFDRGETFVRNFAGAFTVARMKDYAAILHTGPVGRDDPNSGTFHFTGPMGFGGGQLSAFWTPRTGSVVLGRRRGMSWDKNFDILEDWRLWPNHAVSGAKADGKIFTSSRITDPEVKSEVLGSETRVTVSGNMPRESLGQGKVLEGRIGYRRAFTVGPDSIHIRTEVNSLGQDTLPELYEIIPVFLSDPKQQAAAKPTAIEFVVGDQRVPALTEWQDGVTAIYLSRFEGSVRIAFDRLQRVKLSEKEWNDTFMTRAACRNILIDLLDNAGQPEVFHAANVSYHIRPEAP